MFAAERDAAESRGENFLVPDSESADRCSGHRLVLSIIAHRICQHRLHLNPTVSARNPTLAWKLLFSRSCFTYVRHPSSQVRRTYIVVVGVRGRGRFFFSDGHECMGVLHFVVAGRLECLT